MTYEPRGKMIDFMTAVRANTTRIFTVKEAAALLQCKPYASSVEAYMAAPRRALAIYHMNRNGEQLYAGQPITDEMLEASGRPPRLLNAPNSPLASPFTAKDAERAKDDPRAPGPSGYVPPGMQASRSPETYSWPKPPPPPAPTATPAPAPRWAEALEQHRAADARHAEEGARIPIAPHDSGEIVAEEPDAAPEFNCAYWLDGDLVLYGLTETEDGGFIVAAPDVERLKRFLNGGAA